MEMGEAADEGACISESAALIKGLLGVLLALLWIWDDDLLKGRLLMPGGARNDMLDGDDIRLEGELLFLARGDCALIEDMAGFSAVERLLVLIL